MKKYSEKLLLVLFALVVLTACKDEEGTDVGSDSQPKVTLYKYDAAPPADPDNDIRLRVAANNKTEAAYYFVETKAEKEARGMSEAAYNDFVVSNGKRIEGITGESYADVNASGLYGECIITVVAVNGGTKVASTYNFLGLEWNEVVSGTYTFGDYAVSRCGMPSKTTKVTMYVCKTDENLYKIKDLYGAGWSLKFTKTEERDKVDGVGVTFVRVNTTQLPYEYQTYGQMYLRDMAYGYNNDAYIANLSYGCYLFDDNRAFFTFRYGVSAGNVTWDNDEFIPD